MSADEKNEADAGSGIADAAAPRRRPLRRLVCWILWGGLAIFVVFALFVTYHLYRFAAVNGLPLDCQEANDGEDWEELDSLAERWCWWEPEKTAPWEYRAEAATQRCRAANRLEDWEELESLAACWCGWNPERAAPWIFRAEAATRRGEFDRAVELLGNLPDGDGMTPPALVERSSMQFTELNRPLEGAESLEWALRLDPTLVEARTRLIFFYAFTLQRDKMVDHVYEAIRLNSDMPEMFVYLMLQDALSFANAYDENTKWHQGDREEELFTVARAIYRIRTKGLDEVDDPRDGPHSEGGTPYHRQVIAEHSAKFPHNVELLNYHLHLASEAGDAEEVARLLAQAPAEAIDDNRFWKYRGWLHCASGELEEARDCYEKAIALNPYDHISRHQMASVERRFKRQDRVAALEALSTEGKAIRSDLLQLKSVKEVPPSMLKRMAEYAGRCGDSVVAERLSARVAQFFGEEPQVPSDSSTPQ